ncbi:hypothetical protein SUNI508_01777 [Seiridium unicorne]|uniref:Uncharacterized protein n=1 Tax=Seiridium unicorne TaxID=138068 RepID=A0ABR2UNZ7_9PEZI
MVQRKHATDAPRALWATPVPNTQPKSMPSKLLFWKKQEKAEQPEGPAKSRMALQSEQVLETVLPASGHQRYTLDQQRSYVQFSLRQYSEDRCFASPNYQRAQSTSHDSRPLRATPPALLHQKEVARISTDVENIKEHIVRLHHRPQDDYLWWDMLREDLDDVCAQAVKYYFAREEQMWFVPRLAHRCRRVTCSDQYRHREVKEWRWNEGQWWLKTAFPKSIKLERRHRQQVFNSKD